MNLTTVLYESRLLCMSVYKHVSQMQSRPFSENDMSLVYLPGKTQNTEKNNTVLLT